MERSRSCRLLLSMRGTGLGSMKTFLLLSLIALPAVSSAAIYRWVDSDGSLHFSDQKPNRPDVEEVTVPQPNLMSGDKPAGKGQATQPSSTPSATKVPPRYTSLKITTPSDDEAVRANDGSVPVSCILEPALGAVAGHEIQVLVDGRSIGGLKSCGTTLTQLSRGTHSVQVQVVDSLGKVLISSPVHRFHVLRTSRL